MKLSNEQLQVAKGWISKHALGCPVCRGSDVQVGGELAAIPPAKAPTAGAIAVKAVPVVCLTCAHLFFFSAERIGITV